jgi:hypothetical protein
MRPQYLLHYDYFNTRSNDLILTFPRRAGYSESFMRTNVAGKTNSMMPENGKHKAGKFILSMRGIFTSSRREPVF